MRNILVFFLVLLATAAICLGNTGTNPNCTLAGTWYGGSPDAGFPYYHMTFTPVTASRFALRGQYDSEIGSLGYLYATDCTGDQTATGPNTFKGYDIVPLSRTSRPPDLVMDFKPAIVEVYHRMPNACPGCPFANVTTNTTAPTSRQVKILPPR
jgi:hypothetical protein